jgi:hypothetical protein
MLLLGPLRMIFRISLIFLDHFVLVSLTRSFIIISVEGLVLLLSLIVLQTNKSIDVCNSFFATNSRPFVEAMHAINGCSNSDCNCLFSDCNCLRNVFSSAPSGLCRSRTVVVFY